LNYSEIQADGLVICSGRPRLYLFYDVANHNKKLRSPLAEHFLTLEHKFDLQFTPDYKQQIEKQIPLSQQFKKNEARWQSHTVIKFLMFGDRET